MSNGRFTKIHSEVGFTLSVGEYQFVKFSCGAEREVEATTTAALKREESVLNRFLEEIVTERVQRYKTMIEG
jgi:hypothetical protein